MILFRTLLNRQPWMNPLSDVMGGWGIWKTVNGEQKLTTECIENVIMMVPFSAVVMWTFEEKIGNGRKKILWQSWKIAFIFSISIEMLQLLFRLGTFQLSDIKSTDPSFEKSIRLAYINQQMQEIIFYRRQSEMAEEGEYISELSRLMVNEIENVVVKQVKDGILSRYVFKIPIMILEKLAEQNIDGKIALYEEEMLEIECFLREMSMTDNELYTR